ncbi:MAG: cytochrome c [Planctomycetaceae bacterium]|nr:cytochrome c [Planctomycetaceae bacterium]
MISNRRRRLELWGGLGITLLIMGGCAQEMMDQKRLDPQEATDAYQSGYASREIPEYTVAASPSARGLSMETVKNSPGYETGQVDGEYLQTVPVSLTQRMTWQELLERGRERYEISCVICHDQTGSGNGMVPRRGYAFPPSYHSERLRHQPIGYLFHVATYGKRRMVGFELDVSTDDRWAIAAYVRTLQWSQHVPSSALSKEDREKLSSTSKEEESQE